MEHQTVHYISQLGTEQPISPDPVALRHCISESIANAAAETLTHGKLNPLKLRNGNN